MNKFVEILGDGRKGCLKGWKINEGIVREIRIS